MNDHDMSTPSGPAKLSFRVRRNFKNRDWTSIGLRGSRATVRKASARKTTTHPGSAPKDEPRVVGFDAPASNPGLTAAAPSDKDWSEWLWIGLIMLAIAGVATVR